MIWLIGAGLMSCEYAKVLDGMKVQYLVVGRGERSAASFNEETGKVVIAGGLSNFLLSKPEPPDFAVVSVGIEALSAATQELINYRAKSILVEKPAGINKSEILDLKNKSDRAGAAIYVAYNRRFYSSVIEATKIIQQDGGVTSFNFEFTEWSHEIEGLAKDSRVMDNWFLANSSHVVDMAFFLGGTPKEINCYVSGKDKLVWHTASAVFSGAGKTDNNALFSYHANWTAPGRWSVEMLTVKHRLIFSPLETLKIQELSSVKVKPRVVDDYFDRKYKPGLYLQIKAFLEGDNGNLCHLEDHVNMLEVYSKIAGY